MDWDAVIERNREALKRILASLAAMAGLECGGQFPFFPQSGAQPQDVAQAEDRKLLSAPTLPRHLHRAVLRLLRPAEAAVRRLVIVVARDMIVALPALRPSRPRKPDPKAAHAVLRSLGIAVVLSSEDLALAAAEKRAAEKRAAARAGDTRMVALPLFDPLRIPRPGRARYVPAHAAPRILSFDGAQPHRLPPPPAPSDPIDATRLALRLAALATALDDLPRHARRFARWRGRVAVGARDKDSRERGLVRRLSPLRPGRPPGLNAANRRLSHEVDDVLADLQYFAREALQRSDTS
jgi:hypothetical protein